MTTTTTTRTTTLRAKRSEGGKKGKGRREEAKRIGRDAFFREAECARSVLIKILTRSLFHSLSRALCRPPRLLNPQGVVRARLSVPLLSSPRKFLVPRRFRESIMRSLRASCRAALRRVGSHRVDDRSSTRRRKEEERRKREREREGGKKRVNRMERERERESDDDPSFRPVFNNGPLL